MSKPNRMESRIRIEYSLANDIPFTIHLILFEKMKTGTVKRESFGDILAKGVSKFAHACIFSPDLMVDLRGLDMWFEIWMFTGEALCATRDKKINDG